MCGLGGAGSDEYDGDGGRGFEARLTVKLRRARRCEACNLRIEAGHIACRLSGKWHGDVESLYFHLQCRDLIDRIMAHPDTRYVDYSDAADSYLEQEEAELHKSSVRWAHGGEW